MDHWQNTGSADKYGDRGDHQQYLNKRPKARRPTKANGRHRVGCVVWIDGLTDPPADDLEQLVVAGGGLVCDSRDRRATHIVAVNMTAAQTKKLKARKRGFAKPAVTPQWVVDSAARRCKQDPGPYLLWRASGPTDEALAVVRARNNLRKAGFGSEVVEEVVDDASSVSSVGASGSRIRARAVFIGTRRIVGRGRARRRHVPWTGGSREPRDRFITIGARVRARERSRLEDVEGLMSLLESTPPRTRRGARNRRAFCLTWRRSWSGPVTANSGRHGQTGFSEHG